MAKLTIIVIDPSPKSCKNSSVMPVSTSMTEI